MVKKGECSRHTSFSCNGRLKMPITLCRTESQLAGELARFVLDLTAGRQRAFAKLTVRDVFPEES